MSYIYWHYNIRVGNKLSNYHVDQMYHTVSPRFKAMALYAMQDHS